MYFENFVTFQKIVDTIERNFKIYFDNSANIDLKNVVFRDHIKRHEVRIEYLKVELMIAYPTRKEKKYKDYIESMTSYIEEFCYCLFF